MTNYADTAAGTIARLDASLARRGTDAVLRRKLGTHAGPIDVAVRIRFRGGAADQLVAQQVQVEEEFLLSPTQIDRAHWPGAGVPRPGAEDPRIPQRGDLLLTARGPKTVQVATGRYIGDVLVRIKGKVKGQ